MSQEKQQLEQQLWNIANTLRVSLNDEGFLPLQNASLCQMFQAMQGVKAMIA
jgi:hypothetical protein